ncbi:PE domain-containing protein [Saccharopolyspora gregorii]|uniref:PE domain-containing protein n=1 Tax=Saccharopolyspora gregorii TaxID=33914 RepID=UPI0021ACF621|nr:PE domain-containing protein [Saccharopolyspora gregorii]
MTAPAPPPAPGGPSQTITVTPENVLAARRVIGEAASSARDQLGRIRMDLRVLPAASDEVSAAAARVWNMNLLGSPESHYGRLLEYIRGVEQLGEQLEEVARQYGIDEEEIAASFKQAKERS